MDWRRNGGKDASPATRRARFLATYHAFTGTSWSGQDVRGRDVDDDQTGTRHPEELEHHRRIVAREGERSAERSVEIVLRRERSALEVVVGDVDHLDRAVRRGDEGQAVGGRGTDAVGVRVEGDAGSLRKGALLPLQTKVEGLLHR